MGLGWCAVVARRQGRAPQGSVGPASAPPRPDCESCCPMRARPESSARTDPCPWCPRVLARAACEWRWEGQTTFAKFLAYFRILRVAREEFFCRKTFLPCVSTTARRYLGVHWVVESLQKVLAHYSSFGDVEVNRTTWVLTVTGLREKNVVRSIIQSIGWTSPCSFW